MRTEREFIFLSVLSTPSSALSTSFMAGIVEDVTDANYKDFVQAPAAIVAYGIASCEPCAEYDPILAQTAARYDVVRIGKARMHVPGRCREIKKQHQFATYPTTHLFSSGKLIVAREGKLEADELAALINDYLPTSA